MPKSNDLSRSYADFEQNNTLIAVVEMSLSNWLVAGIVPGLDRHPLKKLDVNEEVLLRLLERWRDEAEKAGRAITRIVVASEAGRDGFWLARWLQARGIEGRYAPRPLRAQPRLMPQPNDTVCQIKSKLLHIRNGQTRAKPRASA